MKKRLLAFVLALVVGFAALPMNAVVFKVAAASFSVGEMVYFKGGYLWGTVGNTSTRKWKEANTMWVTDPSWTSGGKTYVGLKYASTGGRYGWAESSLVEKYSYTVYFNANGGSCSTGSKSVTYQSTYGSLPDASRTGYRFDGWYTSSSGGSRIYASSTYSSASNSTLYAHWTANTYSISFNANGGTVTSTSKTVTYASSYGTLPTASRTGYSFNGWFTSSSGGSQITASSTVTITSSQTLYAHWTANSYTVSFNANGGAVSASSKNVTYASTYGTLPTPSRPGYSFTGWYTSSNGGTQITSSSTVTITTTQTLYAQWTANSYTVSFNANGGTCLTESKTVTFDSVYGTLPKPVRDGYDFNGWFTTLTGDNEVTLSTKVTATENHTLYAHWTNLMHTISFDANGGSNAPSSVSFNEREGITITKDIPEKKFEIRYDANDGVINETSKTIACEFLSWNKAQDGSGLSYAAGSFVSSNEDLTLFAQWKNPVAGELGEPTRSRYYFAGWFTEKDGGDQVTESTPIRENVVLYAHWDAVPTFKLQYNANGGTDAPGNQTIYESEPLTLSGLVPTKKYRITYDANGGISSQGYKEVSCSFDHWNTKRTGDGKRYLPSSVLTDYTDTVLYAQWKNPIAGDLTSPTRDKYTFSGWYTQAEGGVLVTDLSTIQNDITLFAHWTLIPTYVVSFDANGGKDAPKPQIKTDKVPLKLTADKPNKHYQITYNGNGGEASSDTKQVECSFNYWMDSDGIIYQSGSNYTADKAATLQAQWINPIAGNLSSAARTGYQFDGWYSEGVGGNIITSSSVVLADTTFYAHWLPNQYQVQFLDGTEVIGTKAMTYDAVDVLEYGERPQKQGYGFVGWAEQSHAELKYTYGQQISNLTDEQNGIVRLYAVWHRYLTLQDLTYSFGNTHRSFGYAEDFQIPLARYQFLFGDNTLASALYYKQKVKNGLWGGNCYGMSSTATMFNSKTSQTSTFDFNETAFTVSALSVDDSSTKHEVSVREYLEAMQISQQVAIIQKDYIKNKNQLEAMCGNLVASKDSDQLPIVALFGPEGGHAVVGYDLQKVGETESRLFVYDCNFPDAERYIRLTTNAEGQYVGWGYNLNDRYDWGSHTEGCWISYIPYKDFEYCWLHRGDGKALSQDEVNILTTNSHNFEVHNVLGEAVCRVINGEMTSYNPDIFEMITAETISSDVRTKDEFSIVLPKNMYTIVNLDNTIPEFELSMVNMELGATATTTSEAITFGVDDEYNLNIVSVQTKENDTFALTLLSSMDNGYSNISLEGIGDGQEIMISEDEGKLTYEVNGSINVSLTIDGQSQPLPKKNTIQSIRVSKAPVKTVYTYKSNETVDLSGMEIEVSYTDGSAETITSAEGILSSEIDTKRIGKQSLTLSYNKVTAELNVTVKYTWWQWIIRIFLLGFLWY